MDFKILTLANTKIVKGEKRGYKTFGIHFAPSNLSGYVTCPFASKGCAAACLNTAGMGKFPNVQAARIRKTKWFFENRADFLKRLKFEIKYAALLAEYEDLTPVFRLNLTSDIAWEKYNIIQKFPQYTFYDYTKIPQRILNNGLHNYHLTFSRSESNDKYCQQILTAGFNIAIVFEEIPKSYWDFPVISGDNDDLRFTDPKNVIVGLTPKGRAKKDNSNFVIKN